MDKTPANADQVDILTSIANQVAWTRKAVQDLRNSDKRCNDGKVRYADLSDGSKIFGDGPVYILLAGKEARLLRYDAPQPDNRATYQNLHDAVDSRGRINPEVVTLGLLLLFDKVASQKGHQFINKCFEEALSAGDLDLARSIFRNAALAELEMQIALQPIREYFDCAEAQKAEKLLVKATSLLQAARRFRSEERKKGTDQAVDGLAHAELERAIRELTSELGRPPFQKEIADDTRLRPDVVRKQLKSCGLSWIPRGGRGKDKSHRKIFR
jgi:hypothetical protein